jgi:hypothetical protein
MSSTSEENNSNNSTNYLSSSSDNNSNNSNNNSNNNNNNNSNNNNNNINNAALKLAKALSLANLKKNTAKKPKAPAYKPEDYLQFDVAGDGNCFYRALYNSAKFHATPGTLDRLLRCIDGPEGIDEDTFVDVIRQKLASGIRGKLMERLAAADNTPGFTIYHKIRQAAVTATRNANNERRSPFLWNAFKSEASPVFFKQLKQSEFKKLLANIVSRDTVYASEIDIALVLFMLRTCGPNAVHISLLSPDDVAAPADTKEGLPNLLLRRLGEHYNFYVKGMVYNEHTGELKKQIMQYIL